MPQFITWCIEHIEKDIEQDGIYRVAANQATVHALRLDVDRGVERAKWKYGNEVHVVCGALKVGLHFYAILPYFSSYFSANCPTRWSTRKQRPSTSNGPSCPISIRSPYKIKLKNYSNIQSTSHSSLPSKVLSATKKVSFWAKFSALFDHFQNVLAHSAANRMAAQNIAIVFGPTLIQAPGTVAPSYQSIMTHNNIIRTLIENYEQLEPLFLWKSEYLESAFPHTHTDTINPLHWSTVRSLLVLI